VSRAVFFLLLAGCYHPDPQSGAFRCDQANGYLCPQGLYCDTAGGLCVRKIPQSDMGFPDMAFNQDASVTPADRTCGDRVKAGSLSNLTNLGAVNTAGDESGVVVTNDNSRIYYLSGTTVMTAALTNAKTAAAPEAVTVTGVTTVNGLAFAADGSLYMAGSDAVSTQIFKMHLDSATQATLVDSHLPAGQCPITALSFVDGDATGDLYVAYPLAGCTMPDGKTSYIAQGNLDKQMGTFVAALPTWGYGAPYLVTGGLTMLMASPGAAARLYYAERPSTDALWTGPINLPLTSVGGAGKRDAQATVAGDCKTLYFSSERTNGKGGLDLWAADIAAQ
jgi:hypothetical protein